MGGGVVSERRLRALWDAIDSRQYKNALKLATQLQSKHPDAPYVLVLKSLVLERLGKPDEALVLCRQAKDMEPADDVTLNTMQIVYQRLGFLDEATLVYENACSKSPGNLELLIALFNCYVRQSSHVKQQQTAMKIYKLCGEEKYLLWAVCSIYLQARSGNAAGGKLLSLAEAMLKKRIDSHSLHDLEALHIYISLLEDQGKYEDALAVLSGDLGSLFTINIDRIRMQADLRMQLHQYSLAAETYKEILNISSDDWVAITKLINVSLEFPEASSSEDRITLQMSSLRISSEEICHRLENLKQFICSLDVQDSQESRRGPSLALVEIDYRRHLCVPEPNVDHAMVLATSILKYFRRFGHLPSFFPDVKVYLSSLDSRSQEWLVNQLLEYLSGLEDSTESVKALRRQISAYQVEEHVCSQHGGFEVIIKMVTLYKENLKHSIDLDPEESILGEELLVMASNLLVRLFLQTNELKTFMEAALVLEYGLSLRRFNFQFKLMLISLYSSLCAVTLALDWFKTLDIKNILLEVSSHHILPTLLASPHWRELEQLLKDSIKFHEDYQAEAAEMEILAYKHSNYSKILEFVELKERLANSHHYLLVRTELALLSLTQSAEKLEAVEAVLVKYADGNEVLQWSDEIKLAKLTFNEDIVYRPWWSPSPYQNLLTGSPSNTTDSRETQDRWKASLKRRSLIPRLLFLALNAVTSERDGNDKRETRRKEMEQHLESFLEDLNLSLGCLEDYVSRSLVTLEENGKLDIDCDVLLSVLMFWLAWEFYSWSSNAEKCLDSMALTGKVLATSANHLMAPTASDGAIHIGKAVPPLVKLIAEPVGWLSVCIQAWLKRLQPIVKKKRKPSEASEDKNAARMIDGLRALVICICSELEKVSAWVSRQLQSPVEEEVDRLVSVVRSKGGVVEVLEAPCGLYPHSWKVEDPVKKIVRSQRSAVVGLGEICGVRLKNLKSLK